MARAAAACAGRLATRCVSGPAFEIVGVAADHKISSVGETPQPYVHYAHTQQFNSAQIILARTRGDASRLLGEMRRELLALEPNLAFLDNQDKGRGKGQGARSEESGASPPVFIGRF